MNVDDVDDPDPDDVLVDVVGVDVVGVDVVGVGAGSGHKSDCGTGMSAKAAAGQLNSVPSRVPNLKMLPRLCMAFVDAPAIPMGFD